MTTPPLTARLRAIVDELDARMMPTLAGDLDDIAGDVEAFERLHLLLPASPAAGYPCERCRLGNHSGDNGTPGCEGGACACRCRS